MSEIPRFQRHLSLLRRGTPDDPCNDRLTIYKGGEKDDSREGSVGPDMMDPILLGGFDDYLDLVNANNNALGDPLLLCEVDRDLGRDCAIIQHGCETKENESDLLDGPVVELNGKLHVINKESDMGHQLDCGLLDGSQVVETRGVLQGEPELITGPRMGPLDTIPGSGTGLGGISNSKWSVGSDMEKINFRDIALKPNLPPPVGFTWEFLERGWALRPSVGHLVTDKVMHHYPRSTFSRHML